MSADHSEIIECAHLYRENGLHVFPLAPGRKLPMRSTAVYLRRPSQDPKMYFQNGENIGVFMGGTSGNTHTIDIDAPGAFEKFRSNLSPARRKRLVDMENSTWVFNSASAKATPGRRQIVFKTEKPLLHVVENDEIGFGIVGERMGKPAYSAMPHSRVMGKDGQLGLYLWQNDPANTPLLTLSLSEIKEFAEFMPFKIAERGFNRYGLPDDLWQLIRGAVNIQRDGKIIREYRKADGSPGDRSRIDQAIVFRLAALNWTFADIQELFCTEVHYGSKFHDQNRGANYLRKCHESALRKLQNIPYAQRQIETLIHEMQFFSFNPRTFLTDATVYRAALEIGKRAGTLTPALSTRRLAEMAAANFTTVHRSLQRIHAKGLIDTTKHKQSLSKVYEIRIFENLPEFNDDESDSVSKCNSSTHFFFGLCQLLHNDTEKLGHDAFRNGKKGRGASGLRRGLGKNGAAIYEYLRLHPKAKAEHIVLSSGMSRITVFRKLALMKETGIVENNAGVWSLIEGHDLNKAAAILGTLGASEEQEIEHQKQRIAFNEAFTCERRETVALLVALIRRIGHDILSTEMRVSVNTLDRWVNGGAIPKNARAELTRIANSENIEVKL